MDLTYKRFPLSEYENRWERAQKRMTDNGLDALFITEANNFTYFSGGHGDFSFSRPTIMVLPRKENPVILIHDFFYASQHLESWVQDIRLYKSIDLFPLEILKEALKRLKIHTGKIGAELGKEQRLGISYNDFVQVTRELPGADFIDASPILWEMRTMKSDAEIDCMRKACEISGTAFKECFEKVTPGMTEKEAVKIVYDTTVSEGGSSVWVVSNSGPYNYESGFLSNPGDHPLEKGNLLWLDTGCKFNGYASDFSRIASIGDPSDEQRRMYELVDGITKKTVEAIRPGIKASDLARVCNMEFEKAGLKDLWGAGDCSTLSSNRAQRIGHGIGMATTEPPHIALFDDTVLKPGMTITIEPTIVSGYGHFNIEADVLVTNDGYEILSKASREMHKLQ